MPINCPLVLRTIKNSKLTFNELDGNFLNLRECIYQLENQISTQDTYVTGGTYSSGTTTLDFVGNAGFTPFSVDVSALTGGTGGGTIINGDYLPLSGGTVFGPIKLGNPTTASEGIFNGTSQFADNGVIFDFFDGAEDYYVYGDGGSFNFKGLQVTNDGEFEAASYRFENGGVSSYGTLTQQLPNTGFNTWTLPDQSGTIALTTDLSSVTGFTYLNNNFTISQSGGLSDLVSNISVMTGLTVNGQTTMSGDGQNLLTIVGSGNTEPLVTVQGSSGELFTITDDLEGLLFSVNDISGLPILEVYDDDTVHIGSLQAPALNTTVKLNPGTGLSTVYSLPISAYTGAFFDYTVSNTTGVRAGNISSIWSGSTVEFNEVPTNSIGSTTPITFTMSSDGSNASLQVSATTTGWEVKTIVRSI
jgi:hypothetical protein